MLGASSGSRLCCSSGPRRRRRWSSPDHASAPFAAGINGPPGDDVEVDLSTPKTGSKAKYSELTARRIKEVQERVDEGKIKLDPANWKWRHSEHEHGYRSEPADYQERAIGVWDPPTIFPGREFRCSRCTGGTMRVRGWYKGARPVFAVDGTYWWLITRNMVCNKFGSQTRATTDDFLSGMPVRPRRVQGVPRPPVERRQRAGGVLVGAVWLAQPERHGRRARDASEGQVLADELEYVSALLRPLLVLPALLLTTAPTPPPATLLVLVLLPRTNSTHPASLSSGTL